MQSYELHKKSNMNKIPLRSYTLYLLIIILAIIQIIASNRLSNYGKKITSLSKQTSELLLENERLKKKNASFSALTNLTQKAHELGFIQKATVLYFDELYSVAQHSL